jgi:hypothetical protein
MTLLSVLRNGDNRFLPLLLSKVHDVLPRLVNPMLQTVPDTPANLCADVDIFDGFGNAGIGIPSNFPGYNGDGSSGGFKVEPQPEHEFNRASSIAIPPFDKRIEELGSPPNPDSNDNTPFTSPSIIQSPMEYPGLADYAGFPDLSGPTLGSNINMSQTNLGNFGEGVGGGGRQVEFKREFDGNMAMVPSSGGRQGIGGGGLVVDGGRRPPLRQSSGSNFGMQIPRSVPEQFRQHGHLQRANSSGEGSDMGMGGVGGGDLSFR